MAIPLYYLIALIAGSLLTSIFSAVFGVAGGMMLFVLLAVFLDAKAAVPIHAIVQTVSNASRVATSFGYIKRELVWRFCILILPGVLLGSLLYKYFDSGVMEIIIGVSILLMTYIPEKIHPKEIPDNAFMILGFVSGFLGMIVGVVGPLLSPFFIMKKLKKEELVATKAACQAIVQLIKIPTFGFVIQFDFKPYYLLLAGLCVVTVIGAWIGRNLISKISDHDYHRLEKIVLTILSVIIIVKASKPYWVSLV